mgnify:FL=1
MKDLTNKRVLYLYMLIAIVFIIILGIIFTQVARHYVINAYEEQLVFDVEFIADQLQQEPMSTNEIHERLQYFKQFFPVDLYYIDYEVGEHVNTFETNSAILQKIRSDYIQGNIEEGDLFEDRLIHPYDLNENEKIVIVSHELPLQYLNTTVWWLTIFLAIFISFFILSFGNRLYENYINPIRKATDTAKQLSEGNYKVRVHDAPYGVLSQLGQSLNTLARNLESITSKYENQNNRLKTVINNMESGLLLINEKGITRLVNDPFINHFMKKSDDYIGQIYYDVIDHPKLNDEIQRVIFLEKKVQLTLETADRLFFEVYIAPIKDKEEGGKGAVVVCHDITKIKQVENIRKDFVANVSHELRTPITSIQGFAETLLDGSDHSEETVNQFLSIIEKESRRLNALVSDLLYLSSLEKDEFTLTKSTFKVKDLMNEAKSVVKQSLEEKNIDSTLSISPDGLDVYADYNRIYQLILNLYTNAIQYTKENGTISWEIYREENDVIFKVTDSGIGIPKQNLDRIFERFYRVDDDRSRETGGTGLGLSIVKHIVEAHDGQIEIESELNEGTMIKILLPQG